MKVLFVLNTPGFLRYFDVTIAELLARGDEVVLAFTRPDLRPESLEIFERWERVPEVLGKAPDRDDALAPLAGSLRAAVDYVRYLDPRFERAEYLRNRRRRRAFELAPWTRVFGLRPSLPGPLAALLVRTLLMCERALPSAPDVERYLREIDPDVVLVSPLVTGASPQTDYVKAAKALGIPCALCVASWDNLTNKGLVREHPHRTILWNDVQRREAIELHGIEGATIDVTGAQPFDRWFGREPSCPRDEFCARIGLPADRPYVMFVGSTSNIAREGVEEDFVGRWIAALRASPDAFVASLGILVRPHPDRPGSWEQFDLSAFADVTLWPPRRPNSVTLEARTDYFDSLYHAAAVVGINTSAMIEATVIGRPVLTVRSSEFEQAQDGTIHFRYLLPENGGFVVVARDLDEHARMLGAYVREPELARPDRDRFVAAFVRPNGLERPSNDVLVDAIERLARTSVLQRQGVPTRLLPLQALLFGVAAWGARGHARRDPGLVRERLRERTAMLERLARRTRARSPLAARPLEELARVHARRAEARVALLARRREEERKRRKALSRAEKQRGLKLLAETRMEVDSRR